MADISTLMAQMLANARPQQAPSPGHTPVMSGGGPGGATFGTSSNNSGYIDIGAIQKFFSANDKEKEERGNRLYGAWLQQREMDPEVADHGITNPFSQKVLQDMYESGDNRVVKAQMPTGNKVPTGNVVPGGTFTRTNPDEPATEDYTEEYGPEMKEVYKFSPIALPEQQQKEASLAKMSPEERKKEIKGSTTEQDILSTRKGTEAERQKLLGAMAYIQSLKGGSDKASGDPLVRDAKQNFAKIYEQATKNTDPTVPRQPKNVFADNIALFGAANNTATTIRSRTGSSQDAMGEIAAVVSKVDKEMNTPIETQQDLAMRQEYVKQYTNLLKNTKPESLEPFATLMDWAINITQDGTAVRTIFKNEFGASDQQIDAIYNLTKHAAAARGATPEQPPIPEDNEDFSIKKVAKKVASETVGGWIDKGKKAMNWWDQKVETPIVNKLKGKKDEQKK